MLLLPPRKTIKISAPRGPKTFRTLLPPPENVFKFNFGKVSPLCAFTTWYRQTDQPTPKPSPVTTTANNSMSPRDIFCNNLTFATSLRHRVNISLCLSIAFRDLSANQRIDMYRVNFCPQQQQQQQRNYRKGVFCRRTHSLTVRVFGFCYFIGASRQGYAPPEGLAVWMKKKPPRTHAKHTTTTTTAKCVWMDLVPK